MRSLIYHPNDSVKSVLPLVLQKKNLGFREVKQPAQGHTAFPKRTWRSLPTKHLIHRPLYRVASHHPGISTCVGKWNPRTQETEH